MPKSRFPTRRKPLESKSSFPFSLGQSGGQSVVPRLAMRPDSSSSVVASLLLLLLCLITAAAAQQERGGADWTNRFCKIHSTLFDEKPEPCGGPENPDHCAVTLVGPVKASSESALQNGSLALDRNCNTWWDDLSFAAQKQQAFTPIYVSYPFCT